MSEWFCPKCAQETMHYKLLSLEQGEDKSSIGITPVQRK